MSNGNSGVGHSMTDGVPGHLVSNIGTETMGKGRRGEPHTKNRSKGTTHKGSIGLLMIQAGKRAQGRKESGGRASVPSRQRKTPQD